jgi:hypothetical protein
MKNFFIIVILLLSLNSWSQSGEKDLVSIHLKKGSFQDIVQEIESQTSYRVIYKDEWVRDWEFNIQKDSSTALEIINTLAEENGMNAEVFKGFIVLIPEGQLMSHLPTYQFENRKTEEVKPNESSQNQFLKGRKADLKHIVIGEFKPGSKVTKVHIEGRIFEAGSGKAVEGATIFLPELRKGSVSEQDGRFSLDLPLGKFDAQIERLGMEKINCQLEVLSSGSFELEMFKANIDMKEVVVYGDRQMNIREKEPGLEKVKVKQIKKLPVMMGESDIIKVSELMPGIISVGEGSAGLNVRGGSFDQNAFYFNHIPIYNTSHMFGFFPAFNADVVDDFSIYKGYIPAQYGGKISSVFDINARSGNKKNYTAHGGISPVAGNLTLEGPIKKDTASVLISGRTSYSDWILGRIDDDLISNSKASFYDLIASFNLDLPKTQFNFFAYHSQDYFKLHDINTYLYSNSGASAQLGHSFNEKWRGDFSLSGSSYQFKTIDQQLATTAYEHQFKVNQYELKSNFKTPLGDKHQLDFGLNLVAYQLERGDILPYDDFSLLTPVSLGNEQAMEASLYISDQFQITPLLELNAGIRFSAYTALGPSDVYTYFEDGPKESEYIDDTISFGKNESIQWYYFPELRLALNYQTDELGSLKLSFNQMHQNIFLLNNAITIAPNSQWKLADYHLKPSRSYQFSLGVFRNLPRGGWEISAEAFYKQTKDYTEFKDGADFLGTPLVETTVLQGSQKSYGAEIMIKRTHRKLDGWLAYTYSRSLIQVDGGESWNQINQGDIYPSNFDIPHVVNAILNYHISKRVTFSTTITYQTGKPITYPTGYYYIEGQPYLDFSKRNEYRIPDYFRTDVSLSIEGNLRKKKLLHSNFVISVYNLTGRENPYSVYFTKDDGDLMSYQYAVIGVPIFTVSWIFKLGNYDAK